MRASHGCARVDIELDSAVIERQACWARSFAVCRYDVHPRSSNVRLAQHTDNEIKQEFTENVR